MNRHQPAEGEPALAHPDAALIRACIHYAAARQAGTAAYDMDPTDDNTFAHQADATFSRRMSKEQDLITRTRPQTVDGLRAKAAVVDMVVTDFQEDLDRCGIAAILHSLTNDVLQFHSGDRG